MKSINISYLFLYFLLVTVKRYYILSFSFKLGWGGGGGGGKIKKKKKFGVFFKTAIFITSSSQCILTKLFKYRKFISLHTVSVSVYLYYPSKSRRNPNLDFPLVLFVCSSYFLCENWYSQYYLLTI